MAESIVGGTQAGHPYLQTKNHASQGMQPTKGLESKPINRRKAGITLKGRRK